MTEHQHETRSDSTPPVPPPAYGGSPSGQQYGPPPQYGRPAPHGQPAQYGRPGPYQPYAPPSPYGGYGEVAVPARSGQVILSAVLGLVYGALGVLVSVLLVLGGVAATTAGNSADSSVPGVGRLAGAVGGFVIAIGILALIWAVLMIWGASWALTGRSRVLLIVGGSISIASTGIALLGTLGSLGSMNDSTTHNGPLALLLSLVFFLGALAIVILVSLRPAGNFFAAHRARRGR